MTPNNNRRNALLAVGGILILALLIFSLTQLLRPPTPNTPERTIQTSQTPTLIAVAPSSTEVPPVAAVQIVPTVTIPTADTPATTQPIDTPTALVAIATTATQPIDTPTPSAVPEKPIPQAGNPASGALYWVWAIIVSGVLLFSMGVALKKISN